MIMGYRKAEKRLLCAAMLPSRAVDRKADVHRLMVACLENSRERALGLGLQPAHWTQLVQFLQPADLAPAQLLISQGVIDRTVYFVESGSLSVHYEDAVGRIHLAIVGAGSAVGEGSFFSRRPRNATVQAASASRVWGLNPTQFAEFSERHPQAALAVTLALGALIAERMFDRRRRVSVT